MTGIVLPWPPIEVTNDAGIYRIDDSVSGAFYIGSTVSLSKRWRGHQYHFRKGIHGNHRMQAIWDKDPSRLSFSVLEVMPGALLKERLAREQEYLDLAKVGLNRNCMNALAIAGSHEGRKRSAQTIEKLRAANQGRVFSDETRQRMSSARLGWVMPDWHRKIISERSKGRQGPKPTQEQLSKYRKYTREQVIGLRSLVSGGVPLKTAAEQLGISRATARRIMSGESYKEVI